MVNGFIEIVKVFMSEIKGDVEDDCVLLRKVIKSALSLLVTSSKNPDTFRVYIRALNEILTSIKSKFINIGLVNQQVLELINTDP